MFRGTFIDDSWVGNGIGGGGELCNVSLYENGTGDTTNVPFVPCGQAYTNGDQIIINGLPMVVGSGE